MLTTSKSLPLSHYNLMALTCKLSGFWVSVHFRSLELHVTAYFTILGYKQDLNL